MVRIDGRNCLKCHIFKSWADFNKNSHGKNGHYSQCKSCSRITSNRRYAQQDKYQYLQREYGLTKVDFMTMYNNQQGCCGICGSPLALGTTLARQACVDHCHTTGKVRGILCNNCNRGIGMFKEDTNALENAILYLKEHIQ